MKNITVYIVLLIAFFSTPAMAQAPMPWEVNLDLIPSGYVNAGM